MKVRLNDIRLLSSSPVLYTVAREYNVPGDIMLMILSCLHSELGVSDSDTNKKEKLLKENPKLPINFKKELLGLKYVSKAVGSGLLTESGENYTLTSKSIAVLNKTSKLQKEMDEKGLPICPRNI